MLEWIWLSFGVRLANGLEIRGVGFGLEPPRTEERPLTDRGGKTAVFAWRGRRSLKNVGWRAAVEPW
jgi:hypothetical protein